MLAHRRRSPVTSFPPPGSNPTVSCAFEVYPTSHGNRKQRGTIGNNFFTNNFTTATSGGGNQNQVVGRLDHAITNNQHIFFRYTYWNVLDLPVDPLGTGLCADRCAEKYDSSAPALGYNWTVTPKHDRRHKRQPQPVWPMTVRRKTPDSI